MAEAANRLARYNIVVAPFYLAMIPVAYFALKFGAPAYGIFIVLTIFEFVAFFVKYGVVKQIFPQITKELPILYLICFISVVVEIAVGYGLVAVFNNSVVGFFLKTAISVLFTAFWIYLIILSRSERNKVLEIVRSKLKKKS